MAWGETTARLGLALVTAVLERFDAAVAPRWPMLRAQVIHSDLTADNVLHASAIELAERLVATCPAGAGTPRRCSPVAGPPYP